jgi:hypothetical protein
MTYLALTMVYLLICTSIGVARGPRGSNQFLAASLAAAIVCAQFALLMTR